MRILLTTAQDNKIGWKIFSRKLKFKIPFYFIMCKRHSIANYIKWTLVKNNHIAFFLRVVNWFYVWALKCLLIDEKNSTVQKVRQLRLINHQYISEVYDGKFKTVNI